MTFSICVRERYAVDPEGGEEAGDGSADGEEAGDGSADGESGGGSVDDAAKRGEATEEHVRFGVAVTTRLPAVGTMCPHVSEHGAIATQSLVNVDLGETGIEMLGEGLAVEDALQGLLNADEGAESRQLHGVDADGRFAFSGGECHDWYGEREGEGYTVAGNLLTGPAVIDAVAETYAANAPDGVDSADRAPLAKRLIDALAAGHAEGGDKREALTVQSAAVAVRSTEPDERGIVPYGDDLRVDASESPIRDLRETHRLATDGFQRAVERYEAAQEEDAVEEETDDRE